MENETERKEDKYYGARGVKDAALREWATELEERVDLGTLSRAEARLFVETGLRTIGLLHDQAEAIALKIMAKET